MIYLYKYDCKANRTQKSTHSQLRYICLPTFRLFETNLKDMLQKTVYLV